MAAEAGGDTASDVSAIDAVQAVETSWTTGLVIEQELPTPDTVRLRMHVEDRLLSLIHI